MSDMSDIGMPSTCYPHRRGFVRGLAAGAALLLVSTASYAADPIKIGLVTALSGQSARAGEALTRGATIAIEEINKQGGVLGRPLELVRRDDESNPAKGLIAAFEQIKPEVPFVVRLDGTNDKEGRALLAEANLPNVHTEATMDGAARKVVELAKGQA